mgnify:FL=1
MEMMVLNENLQPYSQSSSSSSSSSSLLLSTPLISDGILNHRQPELVIPNQNHNLLSRQILPLAQISSDGQSTGSTNLVDLNHSANHGYYPGSILLDGRRRISYSNSDYSYSNEGDNVSAITYGNPNPNPNPNPSPHNYKL